MQAQQEVPVWLEEIAFGFQGERIFTSVNTQKVSLGMNWKSWLLELFLSIKVCLAVYIQNNATETVPMVTVPYFSFASSKCLVFLKLILDNLLDLGLLQCGLTSCVSLHLQCQKLLCGRKGLCKHTQRLQYQKFLYCTCRVGANSCQLHSHCLLRIAQSSNSFD